MASHLLHGPRVGTSSRRGRTGSSVADQHRVARASRHLDAVPSRPAHTAGPPSQATVKARSRSWRRELLLVAALYLAYAASRLASVAPAGAELRNGHRVLDFERMLHIAPEHTVNDWLYEAPRWVSVAAAYFYETMHYALTAFTLIWLWRVGPGVYRRARNWLVTMTFPALIVFWSFPVAPPRALPGGVTHDTVAEQHRYGWWGASGGTAPRGLASLVNENAAMPSLHVGWAIWVGWNLFRSAHNPFVRALGLSYPLITATVVISTGNHYLLDVLAGAALACAAKVVVDTAVPRLCTHRAPFTVRTRRRATR